jgi:hypothetical protein
MQRRIARVKSIWEDVWMTMGTNAGWVLAGDRPPAGILAGLDAAVQQGYRETNAVGGETDQLAVGMIAEQVGDNREKAEAVIMKLTEYTEQCVQSAKQAAWNRCEPEAIAVIGYDLAGQYKRLAEHAVTQRMEQGNLTLGRVDAVKQRALELLGDGGVSPALRWATGELLLIGVGREAAVSSARPSIEELVRLRTHLLPQIEMQEALEDYDDHIHSWERDCGIQSPIRCRKQTGGLLTLAMVQTMDEDPSLGEIIARLGVMHEMQTRDIAARLRTLWAKVRNAGAQYSKVARCISTGIQWLKEKWPSQAAIIPW